MRDPKRTIKIVLGFRNTQKIFEPSIKIRAHVNIGKRADCAGPLGRGSRSCKKQNPTQKIKSFDGVLFVAI